MEGRSVICQLLNMQDAPVKEVTTTTGTAEFFYVKPDTYYLRMIVDANANGRWDTGDYATLQQPDEVYYYPEEIVCKAKWDITQAWNPTARELYRQKPALFQAHQAAQRDPPQNRRTQCPACQEYGHTL